MATLAGMPDVSYRAVAAFGLLSLLACWLPLPKAAAEPGTTLPELPTTLTNLAQLTRELSAQKRVYARVRLEGVVCSASGPSHGAVILKDDSGVELLQLGRRQEPLLPGQRIRLEGTRLLLRQRELGIQISPAPTVDNDGLHPWRVYAGEVALKAGRVPLELDWFNGLRNFGLEAFWQQTNGPSQTIPPAAFWRTRSEPGSVDSKENTYEPGLRAQCYHGFWLDVPDFDLLEPVKVGTTINFQLGFRSRDELVGLRFTGFFEAPTNGTYSFRLGSDDGALLFVGAPDLTLTQLGQAPNPVPEPGWIGGPMNELDERRWLAVEGRISFVTRSGAGLELELRSGQDSLSVNIADASDVEPSAWLNSYARVVGVGRAALSSAQRIVLDRMSVASSRDLQRLGSKTAVSASHLPLSSVSQVQTLRLEEANRGLPVRVRGVITAAFRGDRWFSLQDETRGIFVGHPSLTNAFPVPGEVWEVTGRTAPGNFAPVIVAEQMQRLGPGRMPEPARPTWNELANGSMDVQWVQFRGVISDVQSNRLTLLMREGPLEVQMENYFEPELAPYRRAAVRVRGTLFALWDAATREVQFGRVLMRNARISVETAPPDDPFAAPARSTRDFLLFNAQSASLHPVKVSAQALCTEGQEIFAVDGGYGLRVITLESVKLQPGDLFEAVGYPEISGPSPVLRQAFVRKTSTARLPEPRVLAPADVAAKGLDSMLVTLEGKLIGTHREKYSPVLEMQSGGQLFIARVKSGGHQLSLRLGSRLELTGVYVQTGRAGPLVSRAEGFELLVNSSRDMRVLSQPSWWTLGRLAAVVGLLLIVLMLAGVWIKQLHRQVDQRTAQLKREIRQREDAERQRAIESERSRIAHDLHDDLGSGLTEIGVLASTGQRRPVNGDSSTLFRNISVKARGLIAALEVIVWAVDPDDNSLQSLADYLSSFVGEFLSHSGLSCRFKVPVMFPQVILGGQVRHGLLMAVKESLNNIVRHAAATEVEFGMAVVDDSLEIVIADNGKGFDAATGAGGHGLKNLPSRLSKLGGSCEVKSAPGEGTTVTIRLPLSTTIPAEANLIST